MATRRQTTTIQANHDALLARRAELRKAVPENDKDEAAAMLLDAVQRSVLASRKLRQKLGADAKLPKEVDDARDAQDVEQFAALGDAITEAAKAKS